MWQSRIEIEYYSVAYFKHITEFDALQHGNALELRDEKISIQDCHVYMFVYTRYSLQFVQ